MSMRWAKLYKGTPAELSIEPAIAAIGVVYRTQYPGYLYGLRYFPDFYLPTLGLVIEIDDASHDKWEKQLADAKRTEDLEHEWGVRVVRCRNDEALNDPWGTVQRLLREALINEADIARARRTNLALALPAPRRAPQKERREAIRAQRAARRSDAAAPSTRPTPDRSPRTGDVPLAA